MFISYYYGKASLQMQLLSVTGLIKAVLLTLTVPELPIFTRVQNQSTLLNKTIVSKDWNQREEKKERPPGPQLCPLASTSVHNEMLQMIHTSLPIPTRILHHRLAVQERHPVQPQINISKRVRRQTRHIPHPFTDRHLKPDDSSIGEMRIESEELWDGEGRVVGWDGDPDG